MTVGAWLTVIIFGGFISHLVMYTYAYEAGDKAGYERGILDAERIRREENRVKIKSRIASIKRKGNGKSL